jgi:uncharacterized membrane protein YfcA
LRTHSRPGATAESHIGTQWYRKKEVNLRIAIFFSMATLAGAFGGLLARLINLMDGTAGLEGWVRAPRTMSRRR